MPRWPWLWCWVHQREEIFFYPSFCRWEKACSHFQIYGILPPVWWHFDSWKTGVLSVKIYSKIKSLILFTQFQRWVLKWREKNPFYQILRRYPASTRKMSLYDAMRATLVHIYFFSSFPQSIVLVALGNTKPSHTSIAIRNPGASGIRVMRNARTATMRNVMRNSIKRRIPIPSVDGLLSVFSLWWIFIQILPKMGPYQIAPATQERTLIPNTAIQLIDAIYSDIIEKKKRSKHIYSTSFFKNTRILSYKLCFIVSAYFLR